MLVWLASRLEEGRDATVIQAHSFATTLRGKLLWLNVNIRFTAFTERLCAVATNPRDCQSDGQAQLNAINDRM